MTKTFQTKSYELHEAHWLSYAKGAEKNPHARTWMKADTIDHWRHYRMYQNLDPIIDFYPDSRWLTVGDGRYGNDAHYVRSKSIKVLATDLSDVLLNEAKALGFIDDYQKENAEKLSFCDEAFDFTLCKESYHHFPRPMIALYEMIRVSRLGVILIEPNDLAACPTFFRKFICLFFKKCPEPSFEEVGNYVYPLSKHELTKVALGLHLKVLAFKGLNDFYTHGVEYELAEPNSTLYQNVSLNIKILDFLCKLKVTTYNILTAILFKGDISDELKNSLRSNGYNVVQLPVDSDISRPS